MYYTQNNVVLDVFCSIYSSPSFITFRLLLYCLDYYIVSVYSLVQVPTEISGLNVAHTATPTRIPNYQEVLYFLEHDRSYILKANMIIRMKANSG